MQVECYPEKHGLDRDERHEAAAPGGKFNETVRAQTHGSSVVRVAREAYGNSPARGRLFDLPQPDQTSSTILPMCISDSISRCAPAASASGKRASMTGFRPRVSNSGQTFSLNAAAMRPLLATGCARSVEAVMVSRLSMRGRRSSSDLLPPCVAIRAILPSIAAAAVLRGR